MNYEDLLNDPNVDVLFHVLELRQQGLNPAQINILRMLRSGGTLASKTAINKAVEALVHTILGNYVGSEYGDCIESREGVPTRAETIAFINQALQELK